LRFLINPAARGVVELVSSRRSSSKTFPDDLLERFHAMEHPKIPPPIIRNSGFDFKKCMTFFSSHLKSAADSL
jgi:hypothetical protein